MAKLKIMPELAIIDGLKGNVDFYYWMGIPVARGWPKSPGRSRSPAVIAQWPIFTYAAQEWNNLSEVVRQQYRAFAQRSGLNGRDLQMRGYLSGLYRYELP